MASGGVGWERAELRILADATYVVPLYNVCGGARENTLVATDIASERGSYNY